MVPGNCKCYDEWTCQECREYMVDTIKAKKDELDKLRTALLKIMEVPNVKPQQREELIKMIHDKACIAKVAFFGY